MSEETQIILNEEKKGDLKSFFLNNKKSLIALIIIILLSIFAYFFYADYKKDQKVKISDQYNLAIINYDKDKPDLSVSEMKNIIKVKDPTYSTLALYFLLDNNLLDNKDEINEYFDILINDVKLEKETKNLIIFKKGLFNSDFATENELLNILNPVIKSQSIWKGHALYLMGEYYFSKNEMQKSKEFFDQIVSLEKISPKIKLEAQKRLRTNFSE